MVSQTIIYVTSCHTQPISRDILRSTYGRIYCMRGEMNNRIKEQNLICFLTVCLHSSGGLINSDTVIGICVYLINYIRQKYLAGTRLAKAQIGTIINKLFKVGAIILRILEKLSSL